LLSVLEKPVPASYLARHSDFGARKDNSEAPSPLPVKMALVENLPVANFAIATKRLPRPSDRFGDRPEAVFARQRVAADSMIAKPVARSE